MRTRGFVVVAALWPSLTLAQTDPPPIIDMHLHALPVQMFETAGQTMCIGGIAFVTEDPGAALESAADAYTCENTVTAARTDVELRAQTLDVMREHNIIGVASGPLSTVRTWRVSVN